MGHLIEVLSRLALAQPVRSLREGTRAHALREARTCYDHLAGKLGVALMAALLEQGHLAGGDGVFDPDLARLDRLAGRGRDVDYWLTDDGHAFLADFGAGLPRIRPAVRYCVDWSEQRHHLSGSVGRALLDRLAELGWLRRASATRAVRITEAGRTGLAETFGIGAASGTALRGRRGIGDGRNRPAAPVGR